MWGRGVYLQLQFQFYFPYLNFKFLHTNKTLEGDQLDDNSIFFLHVNVRKMFAVKKGEGDRGGGGIVSAMFCCTVDLFTEIRYLKTYGTDHSPWIYEFLKPTELLPTILTQVRAGRSTLGRHDDFPMTIQKTFAVWSKEKRKDAVYDGCGCS